MKLRIPKAYKALFEPRRYKAFYGGRGSGKSYAFAHAIILRCSTEKIRVLCAREFMGSIRESVHRLLSDTIARSGLSGEFDVQRQGIYSSTGSEIIFAGVRNNPSQIKSMENISICWVEEAHSISETSLDLLIPTIRAEGSELWFSWNPFDQLDAVHQKFIDPHEDELLLDGVYSDHEMYVRKTLWSDNPWFPDELRAEMESCKDHDFNKYRHIWLGEVNADYEDSIIKPHWVESAIDAHIKLGFRAQGVRVLGFDPADTGGDAKATAFRHGTVVTQVRQWVKGDLSEAIDYAYDEASDLNAGDLVYDSVGIGAGMKVAMKARDTGRMVITGFGGGDSPDNPDEPYEGDRLNKDVFRNKRAQYWWLLRDRLERTHRAIQTGVYSDPDTLISLSSECQDIGVLKSELCRVQRKRGANTRILLESKDEMRRRGIRSPNLADALVYCFANPPPDVGWGGDEWEQPAVDYAR